MKKSILILFAVTITITGCDFLEKNLKFLRKNKEKELLEQMRLDSIAKAREDSLKRAEELFQQRQQAKFDSMRIAMEEKKLKEAKPFHVITGSFKQMKYAEDHVKTWTNKGYEPEIIKGQNDFNLVSIGAYNTYGNALAKVKKLREETEEFEYWVYKNK
ncbi:SPOR domain-containing protein [Bacteroidota bacterium]